MPERDRRLMLLVQPVPGDRLRPRPPEPDPPQTPAEGDELMTTPDPEDSMTREHHKRGSKVYHLTVPGSNYDAVAFEFEGRRGGPWYSLDYDESKPTMHIPGEAIPALRAMLNAIGGTPAIETLATSRVAIAVMIAHQRFDAGCLCDNGQIGDSHAVHVLTELVKALTGEERGIR